jgi:hypothetical protein
MAAPENLIPPISPKRLQNRRLNPPNRHFVRVEPSHTHSPTRAKTISNNNTVDAVEFVCMIFKLPANIVKPPEKVTQ